jgi:hypothetical protein
MHGLPGSSPPADNGRKSHGTLQKKSKIPSPGLCLVNTLSNQMCGKPGTCPTTTKHGIPGNGHIVTRKFAHSTQQQISLRPVFRKPFGQGVKDCQSFGLFRIRTSSDMSVQKAAKPLVTTFQNGPDQGVLGRKMLVKRHSRNTGFLNQAVNASTMESIAVKQTLGDLHQGITLE